VQILHAGPVPLDVAAAFARDTAKATIESLRTEFSNAFLAESHSARVAPVADVVHELKWPENVLDDASLLGDVLAANSKGAVKILHLAAELQWRPSRVRSAIEQLIQRRTISVYGLNDEEVLYRWNDQAMTEPEFAGDGRPLDRTLIAKLRGLLTNVSDILRNERSRYYDPDRVLDVFQRYEGVRDLLREHDLFKELPVRPMPQSSGTTDFGGRGYIERGPLEDLRRDIEYCLGIDEAIKPPRVD
jgi:hypothetical protein